MKDRLSYNQRLLVENTEKFLARTVPHEVAHWVVRKVFSGRRKPHGSEWKSVMYVLGVEATRCHNYNTANASKSDTYTYHCRCQEHQVGLTRHRRAKAGENYFCKTCKASIIEGGL